MIEFLLAQRPADETNPNFFNPTGPSITNPLLSPSLQKISGAEFFNRLVPNAIGAFLVIGVVAFVFVMLAGAIGWITSGGDKASVESARGRVTSGVIGLVIMFSVFALLRLIEQFFGLKILTIDIGPLKIQ